MQQKLSRRGGRYAAFTAAALSALALATAAATVNGRSRPVLAGQQASASAQAEADAAAQALVGKPAPAFSLPDQNDKNISLEDTKGKWVVLAFYPMDLSAG